MASEADLKRLNSGREIFNGWRAERGHDKSIPDLSGADLRDKDLSDYRLTSANLSGAWPSPGIVDARKGVYDTTIS